MIKNENYKISVIMPAYRVEKYLEQCINSVINQTYSNIEIIIVDDGGTDGCPAIIDSYARRDSRIIAIHKKNEGYGAAVNAGLAVAKGDFISIVETDDWVEPDMLESLIDAYEKIPNCIVKGSFNRIRDEAYHNSQSFNHLVNFDGELAEVRPDESLELFLMESSIWSAIYEKKFLVQNSIAFQETPGASYQDMAFKFICYASVEKITLLNKPIYNYRVMSVGSSSASSGKALISFENYNFIRNFLIRKGIFEKFYQFLFFHVMFDVVFHVGRLKGGDLDIYRNELRKFIPKLLSGRDNLFILKQSFTSDTNDYFHRHVLPLYNLMTGEGSIFIKIHLNSFKKLLLKIMRFFRGKILS